MPFVRTAEDDDPGPLDAFRKQVRAAIRRDVDPGLVLLMWAAEPGISSGDLMDAYLEETGGKAAQAAAARPGSVQRSPFAD
jgi:hypothetical protein